MKYSSMPFKRDLVLQNIALSRQPFKMQLLDGGGEIPKSQGRGWQFDS